MKKIALGTMAVIYPALLFGMAGANTGGNKGQASIVSMLMPMAIIFVIFYFLLIRPQQKQQKKLKEMLDSLKKGDEVVTRGGIYGKIHGIADNVVTLEIAENVRIKVNREFIAGVLNNKEVAKEKTEEKGR